MNLQPEHEELIARAIRTGAYRNADDVIGHALEILDPEDERLHHLQGDIAEKIDRAIEQFERGEFFTAEQSRADMETRKAACGAGD